MKTITICSSASFYKQVVEIAEKLEAQGYKVIVPFNARVMKEANDYDVSHYKTWYDDDKHYHKKTELMLSHFSEVAKCDAVLVVNNEKHGVPNYIGGNVLMEMALALYLKKKIFILNDIPQESAFLEEIKGMQAVVLKGDLAKLKL